MDSSTSSFVSLDRLESPNNQHDLDLTPRRPVEGSLGSSKPGNRVGYLSTDQSRRPLGLANMDTGSNSTRLKRLSLAAKPTTPYITDEVAQQKENAKTSVDGKGIEGEKYSVERGAMAGSGTSAGPSTPRRNMGMRSSISYSPGVRSMGYEQPATRVRSSLPSEGNVGEGEGRSLSRIGTTAASRTVEKPQEQNLGAANGGRIRKKGETLLEKHADLLTMIARKERRVNELKEDLAQQEASLSQLKSRWTSLMSRQSSTLNLTSPPTASSHVRIRPSQTSSGHPLSSSHRARPASMSISSSTSSNLSSLSSNEVDPDTTVSSIDQSIANLLSSIPGEGIGMEEALEGGKRFWGNLVKTVSAAAGGTVPPAEEYERRQNGESIDAGPGFDLSSLKSIAAALPVLPAWASSPTRYPTSTLEQAVLPPRPRNASRLSVRSASQSSSRSSGETRRQSVQSPIESVRSNSSGSKSLLDSPMEDLLGEDVEEGMSGAKVLTPRRSESGDKGREGKEYGVSRREGSEAGEESDGWGW